MVVKRKTTRKKKIGTSHEGNLRPWLVRNAFMLHLFGMKKFEELRKKLSDTMEGTDDDGHTFFFNDLKNHIGFRQSDCISSDELAAYDENIVRHMNHINNHRDVPIRLKYYQWLAALFTEAYLDRYFRGPGKLAGEMETVLLAFIEKRHPGIAPYGDLAKFAPTLDDLRKCAYWMATGSGKTFLIHLAYLQFKYYNKGPHKIDIDRILLITPNADLSKQHIREMKLSGIPAAEFDSGSMGGYFQTKPGETVSVIEITRFTEDKKDGGTRRLDIENFEKKNLVFVDEAHKGSGGERWKYFRKELAREGFTFEYSATFGQAAAPGAGGDADNLTAFAKTILFDYSYPHFHKDGFGKEYRVLNINEKKHETDRVLLANLLTYYEQKLVFAKNRDMAADYNIADPLWIFVGSKVNVSGAKSDVFRVVQFLNKFLSERDWAIRTIDEFLGGKSGFLHEKTQHDLFDPVYPEQRLRYLRQQGISAAEIYDHTLQTVFNCNEATNGISLVNIKNSDGEIGLKCGDNKFFGDIYVGDSSKFIKIVETHEPEIPIDKIDHVSLFRTIDDPKSGVNILIGAKKFIEGWDCYRVSCMGLINIGKSEGTEIIQLFGRGVRLKGKKNSLKRSTNNAGDQPPDLPLLETLNIFGVDAKYVGYLRNFLAIEGVETENRIEKSIEIKIRDDFLSEGLLIPRWEKGGFARKEKFVLTREDIVPVNVDLLVKAETEDSAHFRGIEADIKPEHVSIKSAYLNYIDWDKIYFSLLEYKAGKNWNNMIFTKELLRDIIADPATYTLYCAEHTVNPRTFKEIEILENVIVLILKKSLTVCYGRKKNLWIRKNSHISELTKDDENFTFAKYVVKINENEQEIIETIDDIRKNLDEFIVDRKGRFITNVYFGKHLFQPLIAKTQKYSEKINISPEGLNDGEEKFVRDLWNFVENEQNAKFFETRRLYLLRNLPKRGVGFYKTSWFYPDFILWVKDTTNGAQRVIFADPKGLAHMNDGFDNEKIQLYRDIKDLQDELMTKTGITNLILDSYILSDTSRADIESIFKPSSASEYENKHVLFLNETGYLEKMFMES